jgi:hypothetical protein
MPCSLPITSPLAFSSCWQRGLARSGFSEASTLFSPILLGLALDEQIVESVWSGLPDWGLREIQLNIARVPQGNCLIACPHTQHERAHGRAPVPFLYFVHIVRPQLMPSIESPMRSL